MSQAIVTFQISDYFPSDFNFTNFSFIISSESREFEQEISYSSKNKISHKFQIPKKEAKYSIKVIKKNSLILKLEQNKLSSFPQKMNMILMDFIGIINISRRIFYIILIIATFF